MGCSGVVDKHRTLSRRNIRVGILLVHFRTLGKFVHCKCLQLNKFCDIKVFEYLLKTVGSCVCIVCVCVQNE